MALLVAVTACGSGGAETINSTRATSPETSEPRATLGLTPIGSITTVPSTTQDTAPNLEAGSTTTATTTSAAAPAVTTTSLDPAGLPDPEPAPLPDAHENQNQIGYLEIPALKVAQNLFEGVTLKTLNNGPGHWPGSALPGQMGNVVVAGHRVSQTHPFRDLDRLKMGDQVIFSTAQGRNVYTVTKTEIVNPDALWIVDQTRDKTATLFACHPKGSTAQRIVVFLRYAPELSKPSA